METLSKGHSIGSALGWWPRGHTDKLGGDSKAKLSTSKAGLMCPLLSARGCTQQHLRVWSYSGFTLFSRENLQGIEGNEKQNGDE